MPANYVLLEKITVGAAGASSVTFSSIPQTGYTDLVVKVSGRSTRTASNISAYSLAFNGSTANFTYKWLEGNGSSASSGSSSNGLLMPDAGATANTFGNLEYYIPNYASSNYKSWSLDQATEDNTASAYLDLYAGLWSQTAAITSITLTDTIATWAANSTFYLYGVAALGTTPVIAPYATGGDTIMTDGTYWYHAFKASGTFTPAKGLSCDVLVVAGGGGAGASQAGGGGAGGIFYATAQSLSTAQTATIGAGGSGGGTSGHGSNGVNSSFGSLTAAVGGGGGGYISGVNGNNGGSGGGGSGNNGTGGSSTQTGTGGTGYGFAGGNGQSTNNGGGGGGAGALGGNGSSAGGGTGGNGGAGLNTWTTWLSATGTGVSGYIAGGGGGFSGGVSGTGGSGGGGNTSTNGTANTGSGGGGWDGSASAGNGGSGLILVRYPV
jgi:hypothetical protein